MSFSSVMATGNNSNVTALFDTKEVCLGWFCLFVFKVPCFSNVENIPTLRKTYQ